MILTASEVFPLEVRAKAIAVFFAIAQLFGWLGTKIYTWLIGTGNDPNKLVIGYTIGAGVMIIGGLFEIFLGVAAEGKSLEDVASPLSMVRSTGGAAVQEGNARRLPLAPSQTTTRAGPPPASSPVRARHRHHAGRRARGRSGRFPSPVRLAAVPAATGHLPVGPPPICMRMLTSQSTCSYDAVIDYWAALRASTPGWKPGLNPGAELGARTQG